MSFGFKIEKKKDIHVIYLKGRLIDNVESLNLLNEVEELINKNFNRFVLNLANLEYLNSMGISILIRLLTKSRKVGGETVISNVSKRVNELFLVTKLNTVFTIAPDEEKALKVFKQDKEEK